MKTHIQPLWLAAWILTLSVPPLRAQLVNDGASRTLINETNTLPGGVTVGTNGSFTLLTLSDNALLTNSAHGVISVNASARSNEVRLTSPTARWLMGGTLFVGSNGPLSTLVVSNGAFVRANTGRIGSRAGSDSNVVVVTGSGSTWSSVGTFVGADLLVGGGGSGNQLIVRNGGRVMGNRDGIVGNNAGASNNLARVSGSGSIWSNAASLRVGLNGTGNRLVIEGGGLAHCDTGTVGDFGSASNNEALVTGPGSLWTNRSFLTIGSQAGRNRLVVSNGAAVKSGTGGVGSFSNQVVVTGIGSVWSNQTFLFVGGASNRVEVSDGGWLACNDGNIGPAFGGNSNTVVLTGSGSGWNNLGSLIVGGAGNGNVLIASNGATVLSSNATIGVNGSTANNNLAAITGAGTLWSNRNDLVVGSSGAGNRLQVDNGATVLSGNLFIGFNSLSADNRVTVNGGTLRVTNASATGVLDVRRGSNVFNAGLIEVDHLVVTNMGSQFVFDGGTLLARKITHNNQSQFRVGNGVSPAMFILAGSGPYSFPGLIVAANAALIGDADITGSVIMQNGSTLTPGPPQGGIGKLAMSDSSVLAGVTIMDIGKNGPVLTNDQVVVDDVITFTFGSVVVVTNIGPTALAAGDRFQLFTAGSFAGILETLSLPPLPAGLRWVTNLLVDGSIEVESLAPSVTTLPASGLSQTTATLNGVANPKGTESSAWFEFGFTTNYGFVTPPQPLGSADANTNFSAALTGLIPGVPTHFRSVASNSFGVVFGTDQSFPSLLQGAYVKASNTGASDQFGSAMALHGDTLVIGAPSEDSSATGVNGDESNNSATNSGAAYVFMRSGDSWVQQAYLKASNTGQFDQFGTSVAIAGDTIVIGAAGEDSNATGVNGDGGNDSGTNSGAAFVFVRNGTNWNQQAYLKANNTGVADQFGSSVAVSGDTIVVGAPQEDSNATGINGNPADNSATNSGAAYVFVRNGTNWTQQAYLKASNTDESDNFGSDVAISGNTLAVGAPREGLTSGAAYVFVRNGTTWAQQAYLKASNAGSIDIFGESLALTDDTLVVGAPLEDSNATGVNGDQSNNSASAAGAAYVFVRSGTTWTQQAYLKASNTEANDFFGGSVDVSGDTVVVGADSEGSNATGVNGNQSNNNAAFSGAAYMFVRNGTNWTQQAYLKASNTGSPDSFGASVAASGELVVVGAIGEDSNATGANGDQVNNSALDSGAAYIFGPPLPFAEIGVFQSNTNIPQGGTSQQYLVAGTNTQTRSFTIRNTGNDFLTGLAITIDGPDAARFSVITTPVAPVAPTSNTTFTVRYTPTRSGTNTATLHIASNDEDENPFNIQLNGLSLSFTEDRDGDGLNDASELQMASLGFNFQVNQTSLVNTLFNNANGAGLFTQTQLQALNVNSPLLTHDALTGLFKLTIGVEKSTDLTNFLLFPMTAPQTLINAEGRLEFQFPAPDNAAFFRLESR